jgi:tetratricopeptide (TPR) repeat protein
VVIALVLLPALAIVLWPLYRRPPETAGPAGAADDRRLELEEQKAALYRALKEINFDHEAGHLSEDDHRALRARYEARAAELLVALDALGPARDTAAPRPRPAPERAAGGPGWTRHPLALAAGGTLVLLFGVLLGLGVSRFAEPERPAAIGPADRADASVPPGPMGPPPGPGASPEGPVAAPASLPPQVLAGMLQAARQSLMDGRYPEAIAAYQAVLKRDPRNVDAMTHLGLIVAIGGHADSALETFDKALRIDPRYAPAHLYQGQVLYEAKQDYPGAVKAWERFLALVPSGPEHERVAAQVEEARSKKGGGPR